VLCSSKELKTAIPSLFWAISAVNWHQRLAKNGSCVLNEGIENEFLLSEEY
jgi:hypothetical protein